MQAAEQHSNDDQRVWLQTQFPNTNCSAGNVASAAEEVHCCWVLLIGTSHHNTTVYSPVRARHSTRPSTSHALPSLHNHTHEGTQLMHTSMEWDPCALLPTSCLISARQQNQRAQQLQYNTLQASQQHIDQHEMIDGSTAGQRLTQLPAQSWEVQFVDRKRTALRMLHTLHAPFSTATPVSTDKRTNNQ